MTGVASGIDLGDPGFVDVLGQLVPDQGDLLPDVLDGQVDVPLEDELHRDPGIPFRAAGGDRLDAIDRVDRPFDLVGDVDVDHLGARPFRCVEIVTMGKSTFGKRSTPISG